MGFFSSLFNTSQNRIFIHTDKSQYYSGERVTGTITITIVEPINIEGVYLKIKGYQYARFQQSSPKTVYDPSSGSSRTVQEMDVFSEKDVFFRRRFCVHAVRGMLMPANLIFPFDFYLDVGLPGAFSYCTPSSSTQAKVMYKVKAEVVVPGIFFKIGSLKHSQEIVINEPLRRPLAYNEMYTLEENVTLCCCINKGHVSMSACIDKNAYAPGETCVLKLQVDCSSSQTDLKDISFALVRVLELRAMSHQHTASDTIISSHTPMVRAGGKVERTIPLRLPSNTLPSCTASLVRCQYVLRVKLAVPWSSDVFLEIPVQLYAPQLANYEAKLQYPENIDFQTMPIVHVNLKCGGSSY